MKKAWVLSYPVSALRRLWSDWADAQAYLSLRWVYSHFVGFVMRWLNAERNGKHCRHWSDWRSLIWVCTVCPGLYAQNFKIFTLWFEFVLFSDACIHEWCDIFLVGCLPKQIMWLRNQKRKICKYQTIYFLSHQLQHGAILESQSLCIYQHPAIFMSPTEGERDILFLIWILLVLASAFALVWHFLVCTISHESVGVF